MILRFFALTFLGIGIFVLMQVVMPVLSFSIWEVTSYYQSQLLEDPKPKVLGDNLINDDALGISIQNINNFPAFISRNRNLITPYKEYKLTIPKIKLYDVSVKVDTNDFEQNLAHLPGSALPGERGNAFVTGHSSIWANLKDEQKALFANLPDVKTGDEILVQALGQRFTYQVVGIKVVDPKDISVLYPPDNDGRYISLMTCVPPGFNTKRLIVLGRLKST